ncbi:hypothetical protein quinque_016286 [Culex quinquefasciatus]
MSIGSFLLRCCGVFAFFFWTVLVHQISTCLAIQLEERMEIVRKVLKEVPLIDGHNDLPWNIRKFLKNQLREFRFGEDLRDITPWSTSAWSHTDLRRLKEGMVAAQKPSVKEVHQFLARDLGLPREKTKRVQINHVQNCVFVKTADLETAEQIVEDHDGKHVREVNKKKYTIRITMEDGCTNVKLHDLTEDVSDQQIKRFMSQYGDVMSVTELLWSDDLDYHGISSGIRSVKMVLKRPIKSYVTIQGQCAYVKYAGQQSTCRHCGEYVHIGIPCVQNKKLLVQRVSVNERLKPGAKESFASVLKSGSTDTRQDDNISSSDDEERDSAAMSEDDDEYTVVRYGKGKNPKLPKPLKSKPRQETIKVNPIATPGIEESHRSGKLASLIGIEGGHSIGTSLGVLRTFYQLGARYLTLTHTCNTPWADCCKVDEPGRVPHIGGLSHFGTLVVTEMNRLGMIVDLSHVSVPTMLDALATSKAPVIFSHSSAHAICNSSRNVPDHVLKRLSANGGLVMVAFYPHFVSCGEKATLKDVVAHINHIRDVAGVDHVGIGAGYDGVNLVPQGLEDVSRYPYLFAELLVSEKWTEEDIAKLAGRNLIRVFKQVEQVRDQLEAQGMLPIDQSIPPEDILGRSYCRYSGPRT